MNFAQLRDAIDAFASRPVSLSPAAILLAVIGVLTVAAVLGLAATGLGDLIERVWTADGRRWSTPAKLITLRLRRAWSRLDTLVHEKIAAAVRSQIGDTSATTDLPRAVSEAIAKRDVVSLTPPQRPTWIGDRLLAVDQRVYGTYRLDLTTAWPRLWTTIPDGARIELAATRDSCTAAARLAGWATMYLPVGLLWLPAHPASVVIAGIAWMRARTAIGAFASLTEAVVDLYGRDLAAQLGIHQDGPFAPETGQAITSIARKDHPLPLPLKRVVAADGE